MPERPNASPSPGAERARRSRARRKRGEVIYRVTVDGGVLDALVKSTRLSDAATHRRRPVEDALALVLADWAARWARWQK